jgi:Asp-tRNA(Asn)/Glu-tRNA(Gln) amidotransferase A subunit family amidase
MDKPEPHWMNATQAGDAISSGDLTCTELVASCLGRVAERESAVGAWAQRDEDGARERARSLDAALARGEPAGPLTGIPVGVKDIFDTARMPTELGSPMHTGRRPVDDAAVIEGLEQAGAVILGKTVTTEFALSNPAGTRNPHDPTRTPGGSSSGSAAAVADGMVPLAVGSQTGGSVIRPAAFCGVYGYKPTFGTISRRGMHLLSRQLDHVGLFARSLADLALIGDVLMRPDRGDWDMRPEPGCDLVGALRGPIEPRPPRIAFVRSPVWDRADEGARTVLETYAQRLGNAVQAVDLAPEFDRAQASHLTLLGSALASVFAADLAARPEQLSTKLRTRTEAGVPLTGADLVRALDDAGRLRAALDAFFDDYDAILTPAAPGEAPVGLETTGDPVFHAMWTLCCAPCLTLPMLRGPAGMPLGIQLVGRRGADASLFRAARWVEAAGPP